MRGTELAGRYRLEKPLGHGGMGDVWAALDLRLRRHVAVKFLRTGGAPDGVEVARFRREAEITAALSHPGITVLFDIEEHRLGSADLLFLVMELLHGSDLSKVVAECPQGLEVGRVTDIARQVLRALAAAHAQGVVHRDIKPANLFLLTNGQVKICDFGIASLADATRLTMPGAAFGSAPYMAPEQFQGGVADRRTDLYALGCVLYELLTGRTWLDAASGSGFAAVMYQHLDRSPAPPSHRRPGVPAHLDAFVLTLLDKSPERRPDSADAALDLLDQRSTLRLTVPPPEPPPTGVTLDGETRGILLTRLATAMSASIAARAAAAERPAGPIRPPAQHTKQKPRRPPPKKTGESARRPPAKAAEEKKARSADSAGWVGLLIGAAVVAGLLYHNNRPFAAWATDTVGLSSSITSVRTGNCLHFNRAKRVWVKVPCLSAAAESRVVDRRFYSGPIVCPPSTSAVLTLQLPGELLCVGKV